MKKLKQFIYMFSSVLVLIVSSSPFTTYGLNWSVIRETDHKQPTCEPNLSFIEKYDGYYLDKNATEDDKVIYLTFDAGYENGNIEKILVSLKKHNAKGAFFVLENLVLRNTDLIKRMTSEGHLVCNHTAKHPDMSTKDFDAFKAELEKMESIYYEHTSNKIAPYYRPPEGKFSEDNLKHASRLGYKTIFWSFAYADWDNNKQPSEEYAIKKILDNTHNGMIILLHPTSATNAAIMDRLLTHWENEGYRFGSLDELK